MPRKPTSQAIVDKVRRMIESGQTYTAAAEVVGLSDEAVKNICYRYRIFKPSKNGPKAEVKEFCFLSDRELSMRARRYVDEVGRINPVTVRQATEAELKELEGITRLSKRERIITWQWTIDNMIPFEMSL